MTTGFDAHAYTIIVRRTIADGEPVFHGTVAELPDLETFEPTYQEAYDFLIDAIQTSKAAFDEEGRAFPRPLPSELSDYSGRVTIRMPKWLHARLDMAAQVDGVSLNQYMIAILAAGIVPNIVAQPQAAALPNTGEQFGDDALRAVLARLQAADPQLEPFSARFVSRYRFIAERASEPIRGSIVGGIQNFTYHPARPTFQTTGEDLWVRTARGIQSVRVFGTTKAKSK